MKVLHVTECNGGGVVKAIESLIRATPEHEHHLLWPVEGAEIHGLAASASVLPRGALQRVRVLSSIVRGIAPDIVHAHSSWAGVYARCVRLGVPVVYQPHCFKFDDPTLGRARASLYMLVERALASRTAAFGTLSAHEDRLTHSIALGATSVRLPNIPTITATSNNLGTDRTKVAMIGRLAAQKDPEFFLATFEALCAANAGLDAVWIGDGEPSFRQKLERNGVTVTGWLDASGVQEAMKGAVYLHTAAYEGFPLSVLDAAACGAPIVARRIPPLSDTGLLQADSPTQLASLVQRVSRPGDDQYSAFQANVELLKRHSETALRDAVRLLYVSAQR